MGQLINLCALEIGGTKLQWMPSDMSKLIRLWKLSNFVVGKQRGSRIKELEALEHLEELCIENLENVLDAQEALQANLKGKNLNKLKLMWHKNTQDANLQKDVLNKLEPSVSVIHLHVAGYGGKAFPEWLGHSSFSNMTSLKLSRCENCLNFPALGQLGSLEELWITEFHGIVNVGPEFYGSSEKPFASLKILRFEKMPLWREWVTEVGNGAFPLLEELYVHDCPSLDKALPSHLHCLTTLDIQGCQKLVVSIIPTAPSIVKYILKDNSRLLQLHKLSSGKRILRVDQFHQLDFILDRKQQAIDLSSTLEEIYIRRCHSLKLFPLMYFSNLKSFDVYGCPNLESLFVPENMKDGQLESLSDFPPVEVLRIRECPKIRKALPSSLPYLTTLEIDGCRQLDVASVPKAPLMVNMSLMFDTCHVLLEHSTFKISYWDSLACFPVEMFPEVETLQIISCPNLKSLDTSNRPLRLKCVKIWECYNLETFLVGMAAQNLKVLSLCSCSKLKSLPDRMCTLLRSLESLQLVDCSELEMFPEDSFPSKLESLEIQNCRKLFACRMQWKLESLTCLSLFVFGMCEDAESFPDNLPLSPALKKLEIGYCENLISLDKGLQDLIFLEELSIWNCPSLQLLPKEGLSSVLSLAVCNCPLLEERYKQKNAEEWSKIAHISCVKINHRKINLARG